MVVGLIAGHLQEAFDLGREYERAHVNEELQALVDGATAPTLYDRAIARTHRQGQKADEVQVDVLVGCVPNCPVCGTPRPR